MAFEIRKLTADDGPAWWRLRLEALTMDPDAFGESAEDHAATPVETPPALFAAPLPGCFVLGAFCSDALIGTVGFFRQQRRKSWHKGRIWAVYVTPGFRGQGLAGMLLAALIRQAQSDGVEQILLSVNVERQAACKLYLSAGFERIGHEARALQVGGRYIDEDYFMLRLG